MEAARAIAEARVRNAFAFIGAGGHHAGRDFFGGYCCFNDVAIAMADLRRRGAARRFAILDTDAHHGDGTRDLVEGDPDVLHVCVCGADYASPDGTKVDVAIPWGGWDAGGAGDPDTLYLGAVRAAFPDRVRAFRPDLLVWYFGFDGHRGDYGDMGLTRRCFLGLAELMVELAEAICGGRLLVVLGGGSRTDLATAIIPEVIARLAGAGAASGQDCPHEAKTAERP